MTRVPLKGQNKHIETVITKMYERYMKPKESILLNVVSCMVDFSTSKSIQMSRDLDPEAKRTLLCISKIDQHRESGLYDKIKATAYGDMELKDANVFCVRNRSQPENESKVTLARARELEAEYFSENADLSLLPSTSCGVKGLSARLVTIQYERIKDTLPIVAKHVSDRLGELDKEIEGFGVVLGSEYECDRVFESNLHSAMDELVFQYSGHGQSIRSTSSKSTAAKKGPLYMTVNFEKGLKEKSTKFGAGISFNFTIVKINQEEELLLIINYPKCVQKMVVTSNYAEIGVNMQEANQVSFDFEAWSDRRLLIASGPNLSARSFRVTISIDIISYSITEEGKRMQMQYEFLRSAIKRDNTLLCSRLKLADEAFSKEMSVRFSKSVFFSNEMFLFIRAETRKRAGIQGMPGTISSHVALRVLDKLNDDLLGPIDSYVVNVSRSITEQIVAEMKQAFSTTPRLCAEILKIVVDTSAENLRVAREKVHELVTYESQMNTCNHYFMDNVQRLRRRLFDEESEQEEGFSTPPDTANETSLTEKYIASVRAMSNDDQRIVDLQIESYAYHKVLRKRLVDYIVLCTRYQLADKPIMQKGLADRLRKAVEQH